MKLLPPADLLERVSGIEQGLQRNRQAGAIGAIGAAASAAQVAASAVTVGTGWLGPWALGLAVLIVSLLLVGRSRLGLRESSEPFRYTCTLHEFKALGKVAKEGFSEMPVWMKFDLSEKLDERIRRLSFLEAPEDESPKEPKGAETGPAGTQSKRRGARDATKPGSQHIEITGDFVVRRKTERGAPGPEDHKAGPDTNGNVDVTWLIEVTPWVRVGNKGEPATLAHSLPYECPVRAEDDALQTSGTDATSVARTPRQPELSLVDYNAIIERVYFSLATHIYRQIRTDVQRKIDLLPTRYLKAVAYFHEAEDYASSNTLDGLDEAIDLYRRAMELFDPNYCPVPKPRSRRLLLRFSQWRSKKAMRLRLRATHHRPVYARPLVMAARAEVGYANALLYRRTLAGMSGRRMNPIYEAPHVAGRALDRLEHVRKSADDAPGLQQAMFDANVCLALAAYKMDWFRRANDYLQDARSILPASYDQDARYLYVAGLLEPRASALRFLRQAVDRDERFEVAQFELALKFEMLWRTRPTLEQSVGELIAQDYERVLVINPSNVAALGHIGYVYWLLGDNRAAASYYRRGLEYKRIRHDIVTADLDVGLARIAAEEGRVKDVYRHYIDASSALLLQGVSDWKCTSAQFYFFDYIGDEILRRYRDYRELALKKMEECEASREQRMNAVARSLVENDYGEACYTYHLRNLSRKGACLTEAREHFELARDLNPDAVLPRYNLYLLCMHEREFENATKELRELVRREPRWADATVAELAAHAEAASREWSRREALEEGTSTPAELIASITEKAQNVKAKAREFKTLVPHPWLWDDKAGSFKWKELDPDKDPFESAHLRELGDLHVQALFEWTLAHLALDRLGDRTAGDDQRPSHLLAWIRNCCWPADFRVLFVCHQADLNRDEAKADLRATVARWLTDDPTAHWALDVAVRRFYGLPLNACEREAETFQLFEANEQQKFLEAALEEARKAENRPLIDWIQNERASIAKRGAAGGSERDRVTAGARS